MLSSPNLPESLRTAYVQVFSDLIDMIHSEEKARQKQLTKKAKADVQAHDSSSDDDDDDYEDKTSSDDEDKEEITDDGLGFVESKEEEKESKHDVEIDVSDKAISGESDFEEGNDSMSSNEKNLDAYLDYNVTLEALQAPFKTAKSNEAFIGLL